MKKKLVKPMKLTRDLLIQVRARDPPTWHAKDVGNDTYGVTRIPLRFGGEEGLHREQIERSTQRDFTQVRAAKMRKTLLLLWLYWMCLG